jgi:ubiquinone/menaquinone biosynthesis C-methylase UbiE
MEPAGRRGLRQRIFARWYGLVEMDLDHEFDDCKKRLLGSLSGNVLEIGPGTGLNFAYFPKDIRWIGIEPNLFMHRALKAEAEQSGVTVVDIRPTTAEQLDVPDESMDAVVSTHVMCSVSDQAQTLQEIWRVLKPGGRLVFLEHVAAPRGTWSRIAQTAIKPAWYFLGDGCQPDRETWTAIQNAGFARVEIERFHAPYPIVGPHIAGFAAK